MIAAGYTVEHARSGFWLVSAEATTRVELTFAETLQGAFAGICRQVENLKKNRKPYYGAGTDKDWQKHIDGCLGEKALAKYLGVYWSGKGGFRGPDVEDFQVRTTQYSNGHLLLHREDDDDKIFWLVTGLNGIYDIRGHILAGRGKLDEFWRDRPNDQSAYFVPQSALRKPHEPTE